MKFGTRLCAVLLCLSLLFGMAACTPKDGPSPSTDSSSTPTTPLAGAAATYQTAVDALTGAPNLVLTVAVTRKTTVGGETFSEERSQTLHIQNYGTEEMRCSSEQYLRFGENILHTGETYGSGTAYLDCQDVLFRAEMDPAEYLDRLLPAALLDARRYGSVTSATGATGVQVISFSDPKAPEAWAASEDATLIEASGSAQLDLDGNLAATEYDAHYTQGGAEIVMNAKVFVSLPQTPDSDVRLPSAPESYTVLDDLDVPCQMYRAMYLLCQAQSVTATSSDSIVSQAGGITYTQSERIDTYGAGEDMLCAMNLQVNVQDYTGNSDSYSQSESYRDGIYSYTEPGGEASTQELPAVQMRAYCQENLLAFFWLPQNLSGASVTETGDTLLIQMTGNDAFGQKCCLSACDALFGDEGRLNDIAASYTTDTLEGYLAIDRCTGLPTAFGYTYSGIHVIDGQAYALTNTRDQALSLPSQTSYESITGAPLPKTDSNVQPQLYQLTGKDGESMWLFGTVSAGDVQTAYLPQQIYDALLASDALAVEYDPEAFAQQQAADSKIITLLYQAQYYSDGSTVASHLGDALFGQAALTLKASGAYYADMDYRQAYRWEQAISEFYLQQGHRLTPAAGVSGRLMQLARAQGVPVRELESGLTQLQAMASLPDEVHRLLIGRLLQFGAAQYASERLVQYQAWCRGDEAALRQQLRAAQQSLSGEELAQYKQYTQAMITGRAAQMLEVLQEMLGSGETVFCAVDISVLLSDGGLMDLLRDAGYAVTAVKAAA